MYLLTMSIISISYFFKLKNWISYLEKNIKFKFLMHTSRHNEFYTSNTIQARLLNYNPNSRKLREFSFTFYFNSPNRKKEK